MLEEFVQETDFQAKLSSIFQPSTKIQQARQFWISKDSVLITREDHQSHLGLSNQPILW